MRSAMQRAAPWALAMLGMIPANAALAVAACKVGVMADLPVTMEGRRASVPVSINGKDTRFWLDSGAFFSIMSKAKAIELGLEAKPVPAFGFYISGIGGKQSVDYTTIKSFGLVKSALRNVDFLVGATDVGNGLIGANIIGMRDTEFDLAHGSVKLIDVTGCGDKAMAYWATPGQPIFSAPLQRPGSPGIRDTGFRLPVGVNGATLSAELDTGAPTSMITLRAATRAGIDVNAPGVKPISGMGGLGRRFSRGWVAPVDKVSIGEEGILRSYLLVIDGAMGGEGAPDMLLGADFVLAHRIFVARSQRRIYFTYAGGPPFLAVPPEQAKGDGHLAETMLPANEVRVEAPQEQGGDPTSAEDFARRAALRFSRHDGAGAIADFDQAIALSPDNATYYRERARAYAAGGQTDRAKADVEKALSLDPKDGHLLIARAAARWRGGDKAGALADAEAAIAVIPPTALDMMPAASLLTELGKPDRAITLIDPVIAAHRSDAQLGRLLNARCWARAIAGQALDGAVEDCTAAIKRDGPKPAYLDSRATAWFRKGDMTRARTDYDAALKAEPRIANSLYMRSLIRDRAGDAAGAKADRDAAIAIRPNIAERVAAYGFVG